MYGRNNGMFNGMTSNVGYSQNGPNAMQAQIQQLQQQLNALSGGHMMQQPPMQQQYNQPFHPQQIPSDNSANLSDEQTAILALFDEFSETEDGKQLVAFIGKFNGFCQSKVKGGKK